EWPQVAKQIWDLPRREYQYAAMELCAKKLKSYLPGHLELFEYMIQDRSWWDTVDFIAGTLVGGLFRMHPQLIGPAVMRWTAGPDFWFHRCSILFQLKYGKKTDAPLLFRLCRDFAGEKEFFIRKAIGWALRQYSKSEPAAVRDFIGRQKLSPLSRKEASKYI
ncbi:MAG: DNA alkylation repair protein, partial [Bacteroidia bacterium]|nr:DNA alkylation repair protein [Bacteroidia bacterium]